MEENVELFKTIVTIVGSTELIKKYTRNLKVPGVVWAIVVILFSVLYSLPFIPAWVQKAALLASVSTLFYDYILATIKSKIENAGGKNE